MHKSVIEALRKKGVKVFEHPPASPDMNLAESFFGHIKNRDDPRVIGSRDNAQLQTALEARWSEYRNDKHLALLCDRYNDSVLSKIVENDGGPSGK